MTLGHLLLWLFSLLLLANALWSSTHSNFNMGLVLVWAFTLLFLSHAVFFTPLMQFYASGPLGRILAGLLAGGLLCYAALLGFVAVSGYCSAPAGTEKALIVLGAGLRGDRPSKLLLYRLDKAYEYSCAHPELLIVTTGGQGRGETVPEGAAMKRYLVGKGIPESRIISEEKSTSTEENFLFARGLLAERGISAEDGIVYVSNAFHCYRAGRYAEMAGFEAASALPAGIPLTAIPACYLREVLAVLYYWVFRSSMTGFMKPFVGLMSAQKYFFYPK